MYDRIKESDWKVFKRLRPLALERYCQRVMNEVEQIIQSSDESAHERYLQMYKIVRDRDKNLSIMFDGFSRSKALDQLIMYYSDKLLSNEELQQLSEENREFIFRVCNR